MPVALETTL